MSREYGGNVHLRGTPGTDERTRSTCRWRDLGMWRWRTHEHSVEIIMATRSRSGPTHPSYDPPVSNQG